MKRLLLASVFCLAIVALPSIAAAGPPGYYANGIWVNTNPYWNAPFPVGPTTSGFSYYSSPYGYRTYNSYSYTPTPWGVSGYNYSGTMVRPLATGPLHSVYWDPFANQYRYSTGYSNTPNYFSYNRYGYGW
ncbi:MAG: hypothetical protein K8T89_09330 [Planctomycetes bacterium]|nr:hypothetical protein [Planctomycetota bacterium]